MLLWNKLSNEDVQMEQMKEKGKPSEKNECSHGTNEGKR